MKNDLSKDIIQSIKEFIKKDSLSLHEPSFIGNEIKYLYECIKTNYVSTAGKFVDDFAFKIKNFTKAKYVVPVINGTSGIHISLLISGVERNDEVIIPSMTFAATANAICYCSAIPHFVDNEENNLGIDPYNLRKHLEEISSIRNGKLVNKKTDRVMKAIMPMHTFGHPSKLTELKKIAEEFNLILIEDAAESFGSFYNHKHTGTFGIAGIISFNGNKTITTGGGGAILTNNEEFAIRAKHLTSTAKLDHKWDFIHNEVGYNYRMPNINAALGCAQIEKINITLKKKRRLFQVYKKAFNGISGIELFKEPSNCQSNYWLQTILLKKPSIKTRNKILLATNDVGIRTRPVWKLLHKLKHFKNAPRASLKTSEYLEQKIINLPSSSFLIE